MNDSFFQQPSAADSGLIAAELGYLTRAVNEHAVVAITDARGRITYVNDAFCRISQYSREELIGQDHRMVNSGHHPKEFMRELWETITQGRVWHGEVCNRAKDGSLYWMASTIVPLLGQDGKPVRYMSLRTDITPRKMAEAALLELSADLEKRVALRTEELAATNRRLQLSEFSVDHASVATFWVAPDARILHVNEASTRLTGYTREELLRMTVLDLDSTLTPEIWRAQWEELRERKHTVFEAQQRRKSGECVPIEVDINWFEFSGKEYNFTFVRDISGRKQVEATLLQETEELRRVRQDLTQLNEHLEERVSERTAEVERLLRYRQNLVRRLGHDLKTPLTPLLALLPLLLDEEEDPARREMLELSLAGAQSIHSGVARILELCRLDDPAQPLRLTQQNLRILVEIAITRSRNVSSLGERLLANEVPADIEVTADASLIPEALVQIITNALKFTSNRGHITITASVKGREMLLCVADDGIGLEPTHLDEIFDPFFKADPARQAHGSPGLGLTIARTIIERHEGCIWAESAGPKRGMQVYLTLSAIPQTETLDSHAQRSDDR